MTSAGVFDCLAGACCDCCGCCEAVLCGGRGEIVLAIAADSDVGAAETDAFAAVDVTGGTDADEVAVAELDCVAGSSMPVILKILACQSPLPVASNPPTSDIAIEMTEFLWPCSTNCALPVLTSQH